MNAGFLILAAITEGL
jgi:hypothetical protein